MQPVATNTSPSENKEPGKMKKKAPTKLPQQNKKNMGFENHKQPKTKLSDHRFNTTRTNMKNAKVFFEIFLFYMYDSASYFSSVISIVVLNYSDAGRGDQYTQQETYDSYNVFLQRVKQQWRPTDLEIEQPQQCQEQMHVSKPLLELPYMNNLLTVETEPLDGRIRSQHFKKLEILPRYLSTFFDNEAVKSLSLSLRNITNVLQVFGSTVQTCSINNVSNMAYASIRRMSLLRCITDVSRTHSVPTGDPKAVQAPDMFVSSSAALLTRHFSKWMVEVMNSVCHLWRSLVHITDKMNQAKASAAFVKNDKTSKDPSTVFRTTVCNDQARRETPSARNQQLQGTMHLSGRTPITTEDPPIDLLHERAQQEKDFDVMPDVAALPTEEKATKSIRSDEESAAESHGRADTPLPFDMMKTAPLPLPVLPKGTIDEGGTVAVPSDIGDEGGMSNKRRDHPESEEDHDDFVVQSNHQFLRLHIPSKLLMESFATSTPEDVILEEPDARVELTPCTDNKGTTKMSGEQKPYASLHGDKMSASESIDRAREGEDMCQPTQQFPTDSTGRSIDVSNGDESASISLHKKAAASSGLDRTQDKRIPMLAAYLPIPAPFLAITAQPVMPQSIQEGLARVDFRSPDRESMNVEGFRVGTFNLYPRAENHPVLRLANAGFYYTGRGDTLACFCCDVTFTYAERRPGEDPYDIHRRLNPNCPHLTGGDTGNVFIQDDQTQVATNGDITGSASQPAKAGQLVSEARQNLRQGFSQYYSSTLTATGNQQNQDGSTVGDPTNTQEPNQSMRYNNNINETNLADAATATAHTVKGNDTIGISNLYNRREINREQRRPETANQEISPQAPPRTAAETERPSAGNVPGDPSVSEGLRAPSAPPDTGYDPAQAVHPRYKDLRQREHSYSQWPDTHAQSPRELAVAGFFFTGVDDCVRCHYCGLGLKHWDPDDRPLDEHMRWRSTCGFLRALCGEEFILRTLQRLGSRSREGAVDLTKSAAAEGARAMGFSNDVIQRALITLLSSRAGPRAITTQNLINVIVHLQARDEDSDKGEDEGPPSIGETEERSSGDTAPQATPDQPPLNESPPPDQISRQTLRQLEQENQELTQRRRCKVCLDNDINILFLPCGHLVCCAECARKLNEEPCPVCRKNIISTIDTMN